MNRFVPSCLVLLFLSGLAVAAPPQVEFVADLVALDKESDLVATLTLQLSPSFTIKVRVTEATEIRGEGDVEVSLADLKLGMTLKVKGLFYDGGILAKEIQVVQGVGAFVLRGVIGKVDADRRSIVVEALTIKITPETDIYGADGEPLEFGDLKPSQCVWIEGKIVEGVLVAVVVRTKTCEFQPPRISFDGIVTSIKDSELRVLLEGVDVVPVRLDNQTIVKGDLAVGAAVHVVGTIEPDLAVRARLILVQRLLMLMPNKLRLRVDQAGHVVAVLFERLQTDVELKVQSKDPKVAQPSASSLVIPAGKVTGAFTVTGKAAGKTAVEVSLPQSLGGMSAAVEVEVVKQAEPPPVDKLDISWSSPAMSIKANTTRSANLHLSRPAPTVLDVKLRLLKGNEGVVKFPDKATIGAGAKMTSVEIKAGPQAGKVVIRASLPDTVGGDTSDLEIEVTEK